LAISKKVCNFGNKSVITTNNKQQLTPKSWKGNRIMNYNSNIERQNYATATKEEKARHNGVDTSRWGNTIPRIENIPEG